MSQRMVTRDQAAGCPVHQDPDGVWRVHSYAAVREVLRSTQTRQRGFGADNARRAFGSRMRPSVLFRDGPEHREHRRQTARYFTPRRVQTSYRELMHRYAEQQLARLRRGPADLSDLTFRLAVAVAGDVIGLSPGRRGMARRLELFFTEHRLGSDRFAPIRRRVLQIAIIGSFYLFDVRPAIRARRRRRRDDLISHLLDEGCTSAEILGECVTFGAAGMMTTREFITVAAWHLFTDDALRAAYLGGDQAGRIALLHEILRLEPVVGTLARWTTAQVAVPDGAGTVTIPSGAPVELAISDANLDQTTVGATPTQVCPGRPLPDGVGEAGLSFGDGPHRCPGAHIAIQETDIFLTKLFALPGIRMVSEPSTRLRTDTQSYELKGLVVATG
ncbi:MAG: cytochrome P450 [Micromonosporaceae bacterium]|nr:cytochrome P450 [Micromonosporaceae bacterium]